MGIREEEQHGLHGPEELDGHGGRAEDGNVQGAAAGANWSKSFYQILTNQRARRVAVVGATFVLLHATQEKPAQGAETLKFFDWAFHNGKGRREDYISLPESVVSEIRTQWKAKIKDASGKPVAN